MSITCCIYYELDVFIKTILLTPRMSYFFYLLQAQYLLRGIELQNIFLI